MRIKIDENLPTRVTQTVEDLLNTVELDDLASCIAVYRDGDLRVRRPS